VRSRKRLKEDLIAAALIATVIILFVFYRHKYTFRLLFDWPTGGTWSSVIAWLESDGIILFLFWYFRERIGARWARWWREHQSPHTDSRIAEIRAHVTSELSAFEEKTQALLAEHHDRILGAVNGNGNSNGNEHESKNAVLAAADEDDEDGRTT
jgi:hypothetical protein